MAKVAMLAVGEVHAVKVGTIEDSYIDDVTADMDVNDVTVTMIIQAENCNISITQKHTVGGYSDGVYPATLDYCDDLNGNSILTADDLDDLLERAYDGDYSELDDKIAVKQREIPKRLAEYNV